MFDTMSQDNFLGGTLTVGQFRQCKLPKNKKSQVLTLIGMSYESKKNAHLWRQRGAFF